MKDKIKVLIVGHARHGKDSLAEIFEEHFDFSFQSSSEAASEIFLFELMKEKYNYETPFECFEDRVNHRDEWFDAICEYNKDDKARLAKGIISKSDCYVGMRDRNEILECLRQGLFDLVIWVDACERLPLEPSTSFKINKSDAHIIIDNNSTYEDFVMRALALGNIIFNKR